MLFEKVYIEGLGYHLPEDIVTTQTTNEYIHMKIEQLEESFIG